MVLLVDELVVVAGGVLLRVLCVQDTVVITLWALI